MTVFETSTHSLCNSLKQMKLYKVVLFASVFLILVPLFIHYYLVNVSIAVVYNLNNRIPLTKSPSFQIENNISSGSSKSRNAYRSRGQLDVYEDYTSLKAADLKLRIDEMVRIKVSTD